MKLEVAQHRSTFEIALVEDFWGDFCRSEYLGKPQNHAHPLVQGTVGVIIRVLTLNRK